MSINLRSAILLAKTETTYGVTAAPVGATNAILMSKPDITPLEGAKVSHDYVQAYWGNSGSVQATQFQRMKFRVELAASGTAGLAPAYASLLKACGMSLTTVATTSATFAPVTATATDAVTMVYNVDGQNHLMLGSRGDVVLGFEAENLPYLDFTFTGLGGAITRSNLSAPTLTAYKDAIPVNKDNTTFNLHGRALVGNRMTINVGAEVGYRNMPGLEVVRMKDRKSSAELEFEDEAVDVKDWIGASKARTKGSFQIVHGTTPGNIITISGPAAQLEDASYGDIDNFRSIKGKLNLCPVTGNDEWSIAFT